MSENKNTFLLTVIETEGRLREKTKEI